ncbi:ER membrane protein complex subunit 1-like [Mya arenaria]|uniref:ER membrane protein complex subunit 1-like n=1 Tax=Mya arenaria TaxID=6604 RepID=UPI0022E5E64F|nr:ER membrane protein complex subunit 1-like [Mya arenaria]
MWKLLIFVLFYSHVDGLYEDQIGKFDWRQQHIGLVTQLFWESASGSSSSAGKRLYVSTDSNVIAALNSVNGQIVWRRVFEEERRGEVDDMLYTGNYLLTVLGGNRLQAWQPGSGTIMWEVAMKGETTHTGKVGFAEESGSRGVAVGLSSERVYGVNIRDGTTLWDVELPNSDVVKYKHVQVYDGTVYVVGMTMGAEVKVISIDTDGTVTSTKSVLAAFIRKDTSCEVAENSYLMCVCPSSESLQVISLTQPATFTSTSLQDMGVSEGTVDIISSGSGGTVLSAAGKYVLLVTIATNNKVSIRKQLPKALIANTVTFEDREFLLYLENTGSEEVTVFGIDLETGESLGELGHSFNYAHHNGKPTQFYGLLAKRAKDGKLAYKLAIVSQDYSLQLIHKSGKVGWRREECLAYVYAVEMVDLPVSENQAKFEDEFGSHEDNVVTMFMKRVRTQLSQLQTFIMQQVERLQGVKHHTAIMEGGEEEEDEEDLLRDEFSLHKMVILVTRPGKVLGMRSQTGHIVWQHLVPDLAPFMSFGRQMFMLHTQRTTAHFPHHPQCVVLGKNKASGRGHLYAFNPITAETVSGMSGTGEHLPYSVKQAFVLGTWDENFMKAFIMLDDSHMVRVYPETMKRFVQEHSSTTYMFLADIEHGALNGFRLHPKHSDITVDPVWTVNLQNTRLNMKITNIVSRPANEHIHSVGRVLGDRSVLYKYLNPNLVVITTEGEEPATSQQKAYPVVNVYVVDVVTGHMVFHGNHRKASGPLHVVHSENWVVYGYLNMKQHRYEMAGLEMYEGKIQSNVTAFSSLSAPVTPLVLRHSFIFPLPVASMATTVTEKGITAKDLLIALKNGGIFSLPKAFLDPRRPLAPTQETQEEGTLPYIPELPVHTEGIINYNRTLFHVRGLHTAPTGLESTSLVLAYGLDLFQTRVQPSKMFDVLKEDFEHYVIAIVVLSMLLVSFITKKLASRKALNKQWK